MTIASGKSLIEDRRDSPSPVILRLLDEVQRALASGPAVAPLALALRPVGVLGPRAQAEETPARVRYVFD